MWNKGPLPGVSQAEYYRQVIAVIDILKRGEVSKMVLSRSIQVEAEALRLAPVWFERLAGRYPEAFVFLVSVPGVMTWMGASPKSFSGRMQKEWKRWLWPVPVPVVQGAHGVRKRRKSSRLSVVISGTCWMGLESGT